MSQYFSAPLHLNPAMAGLSYGPRVTLNYRNQWSGLGDGFNGGYTTYMAGADMHIFPNLQQADAGSEKPQNLDLPIR